MPSPVTFDADTDEDSEHQSNNNYEIASNETTTNTNSGDESSHPIFIENWVAETYQESLHPGSTSLYDEPPYKSSNKDTPEPSLPSVGTAVNNSTGALQQLDKSTRHVPSTNGTISTVQQQNQLLDNNNRHKLPLISSFNNVLANQTVLSSVTIAVITQNHLGTRGAMALGLATSALLQKIGEKRSIKSGISRLNNKRKKLFGGLSGQSSSLDSCDGVVSSSSVGDLPVGRDTDVDMDMDVDMVDGDTRLSGNFDLVGRVEENGDVVNEQESMIVAKSKFTLPYVLISY